jgi:hypothetical protein
MEGKMESVVKYLYRSRKLAHVDATKWQFEFEYRGDVANLVRAIESKAAERGLTLSRWQTNSTRNSHICTVTYALHFGWRNARAKDQYTAVYKVSFPGLEGTTQKCRAYRELWKLFCSMV